MRDLLKVNEKAQRWRRFPEKNLAQVLSCIFSFSAIFQCVHPIPLPDWKEFWVDSCAIPVLMKDQKKYAEIGVLDQIIEVWVC